MSVRSKIIGTWECLSWKAVSVTDPNDVIQPFTEHIRGNLVYSEDGYMASILQHPDVPNFTPGPIAATAEEYQKAGSGMMGYHGRYYLEELDDEKVKLYHEIMICLPVNWTGDIQERLCSMWEEDGRLYMKLGPDFTTKQSGIERRTEVMWRKREPNTKTAP